MLDLAVEYIKDLQKQFKVTDSRPNYELEIYVKFPKMDIPTDHGFDSFSFADT